MLLLSSRNSPFVWKVRMAIDLLGLTGRVALQYADTTNPDDELRRRNPLGKIPTLVLESGEVLFDSPVIVAYLDDLAGGNRLIPADPRQRFPVLRLEALGDGVSEAAVLMNGERKRSGDAAPSPKALALQQGKIDRGLAALGQVAPVDGAVHVGHLAMAAALAYLDFRFEGAWRATHPGLVTWLDGFSRAVPSAAIMRQHEGGEPSPAFARAG